MGAKKPLASILYRQTRVGMPRPSAFAQICSGILAVSNAMKGCFGDARIHPGRKTLLVTHGLLLALDLADGTSALDFSDRLLNPADKPVQACNRRRVERWTMLQRLDPDSDLALKVRQAGLVAEHRIGNEFGLLPFLKELAHINMSRVGVRDG